MLVIKFMSYSRFKKFKVKGTFWLSLFIITSTVDYMNIDITTELQFLK